MNISPPEEFKKVCRNLVQGLEASSEEELILVSLLGIEPHERPVIKAYLDELLSGRYTPDQLKDVWWSMPADLVFHEGEDVAAFLTMLRNAVAQPV